MPATGEADPVDIHVGTRIRARRKLLDMSQASLAEKLNLTFQQVQKYERGANRVSASKLFEIARALGVAPGYFFDGLGINGDGSSFKQEVTLPDLFFQTPGAVDLARAYLEVDPALRSSLLHSTQAVVGLSTVNRGRVEALQAQARMVEPQPG